MALALSKHTHNFLLFFFYRFVSHLYCGTPIPDSVRHRDARLQPEINFVLVQVFYFCFVHVLFAHKITTPDTSASTPRWTCCGVLFPCRHRTTLLTVLCTMTITMWTKNAWIQLWTTDTDCKPAHTHTETHWSECGVLTAQNRWKHGSPKTHWKRENRKE